MPDTESSIWMERKEKDGYKRLSGRVEEKGIKRVKERGEILKFSLAPGNGWNGVWWDCCRPYLSNETKIR